ncbi:unnamed protein product, partial [Pleuronectes platessa]
LALRSGKNNTGLSSYMTGTVVLPGPLCGDLQDFIPVLAFKEAYQYMSRSLVCRWTVRKSSVCSLYDQRLSEMLLSESGWDPAGKKVHKNEGVLYTAQVVLCRRHHMNFVVTVLGVSGSALSLLSSYLNDHTYLITWRGSVSEPCPSRVGCKEKMQAGEIGDAGREAGSLPPSDGLKKEREEGETWPQKHCPNIATVL